MSHPQHAPARLAPSRLSWRAGLTALGAVLLVLLLWLLPRLQVAHIEELRGKELTAEKSFDRENEARKTLAQILGGALVLTGLYYSAKTFGLSREYSAKTFGLAREGHITDRFTKAIEQLGKTDGVIPNIEVRLGAIYALERIAHDSPRDHWTIMEVLTAYVRQNAPLDPGRPYFKGEKPRTDIQAILTVLGRRKINRQRERPGRAFLNLSLTRLDGVNLRDARLQGVKLIGSSLKNGYLKGARLERSDLTDANLTSAILERARLDAAKLVRADLHDAVLTRASLPSAIVSGAYLTGAYLHQARFMGAVGLRVEQVQSAVSWQKADYSAAFRARLGLPPESTPPA